jgi:hypothetical protein
MIFMLNFMKINPLIQTISKKVRHKAEHMDCMSSIFPYKYAKYCFIKILRNKFNNLIKSLHSTIPTVWTVPSGIKYLNPQTWWFRLLSQMCMTFYTFQEEWHTFYNIRINRSTVGNDTLWKWKEGKVCYIWKNDTNKDLSYITWGMFPRSW